MSLAISPDINCFKHTYSIFQKLKSLWHDLITVSTAYSLITVLIPHTRRAGLCEYPSHITIIPSPDLSSRCCPVWVSPDTKPCSHYLLSIPEQWCGQPVPWPPGQSMLTCHTAHIPSSSSSQWSVTWTRLDQWEREECSHVWYDQHTHI